jgi:dienelactone hydrolase
MRNAGIAIGLLLFLASDLMGVVRTRTIDYRQGDTALSGYLAFDDAITTPRPAVLIVHEWWGNDDYTHRRAQMIAELGYVGFAIDMYGKGKITRDAKQAGEWANQFKNDPELAMARAQAGLDTLKQQPMVDPNRIAAIGYCFGGGIALHMARNNFPLVGVVSFHGELSPGKTPAENIKPRILVCHGADDTFVPQSAVNAFIDEMKKAHATWELIEYSNAVHAFTNPGADDYKIQGIAYNKLADERSWEAMKSFLADVFGTKQP